MLLTDESKALIRERIDRIQAYKQNERLPDGDGLMLFYSNGIVSASILNGEGEAINFHFGGVQLAYALAYVMGLDDALEVSEGYRLRREEEA